jgi:hypothetical protein
MQRLELNGRQGVMNVFSNDTMGKDFPLHACTVVSVKPCREQGGLALPDASYPNFLEQF